MKSSLVRIRHARSKKDFPFLNLEEHEYVELAMTRTKKGLIMAWAATLLAIIVLGALSIAILNAITRTNVVKNETMMYFWIIVGLLFVLLLLGALMYSRIYLGNKMFITNKRVFQFTQTSLFAKSANIIELSRIEDVSYKQHGVLDHVFNFGTLRMSTVGDETTYTFPFLDTPTDEVELIAHLIYNQKKKD